MTGQDKEKPFFHPVFGITSIKNHVALVLDMENVQYDVCVELFLNTAKAFEVSDHLFEPSTDDPKPTTTNKVLWDRLDAIVKQCLYDTIFSDLLQTVVESGSTAKQTWERIRHLFLDNKHSRVVLLEHQLSVTHMDHFLNVSSYCQALKSLADQLKNVGTPITNYRLARYMVKNLSAGYDSIAALIQQGDPLPQFLKDRSMLTLEETRKAKAASASPTTVLATITDGDESEPVLLVHSSQPTFRQHNNRGRSANNRNF
ncbi:hypothetical protein vseg_002073 [Gypsophila vaccaria]